MDSDTKGTFDRKYDLKCIDEEYYIRGDYETNSL